ncbi:Synaptic vesicle glycoprotein 2B [Eumeta japonica]|uniref:Synaptic vesicle glycoprotein 2B n=1 Tax=Eumeta variegata TaxID=151549 RepID=A0A4C1XCG9_EUMVA|nr:Synaptic vesicle glycoprotein 2B [Eumeta japonica]
MVLIKEIDRKPVDLTSKSEKCHAYEEALDLAGTGRYNLWLLIATSVVTISMGLDMFGFSVVVAGCTCDFQLTLTQKGILTSMPFAGAITMAYPWGYFSDTRGRRNCLLVAMTVSCACAVLCSFSPNWIVMAVLKMIGTSFCSAVQSITYSLLGECTPRRVRGAYMMVMTASLMSTTWLYFVLSFVLKLNFVHDLGIWGITFRPWRLLALIMATPLGLGALCLSFCFESPKFLANQGRTEDAVRILRKIHAINYGNEEGYSVKSLHLEEENNATPRGQEPILASIWNQTVPLFKPPLLWKTLQLYYLTAVIYSSNNSFVMWYPFITNAFFVSYGRGVTEINGLCQLITAGISPSSSSDNSTTAADTEVCRDSLEDLTVYSGILLSVLFTIINLILAKFSKRKKVVMITTLLASIVGGVVTNLVPEAFTAMALFMLFLITAMGIGILFSYYVDLYPTSYRGMVACLGVMVARLSSLIGTNVVGAFIKDHCTTTFYAWSVYICCSFTKLSSGKRTGKPSKSRWSSLPMESRNPKGVTSALPASWEEIGFLVERKSG